MICEAAGTCIGFQDVGELEREPFGAVAIVVVPLTDEIAIGGVQRDISEPAEGQSVCLRIHEAYAVKSKMGDIALEPAAIAELAVAHDHEFALRIGLVRVAANGTPGKRKPAMAHHQATDPG